MTMRRLTPALAFLSLLIGLPAHATPPGDAYTTVSNIPYRSGQATASDPYLRERCTLDVYYPLHATNFSTLVWFHGGGMQGGRKSIPAGLKEKGIAVVAAEYRLYPNVKCPAYLDDAAAAVAWTFTNIAE